jgi:UPF0755 protein
MAERPPELRRYRTRSSGGPRILAAVAGVLLGVGVLAAVGFGLAARGGGDEDASAPVAVSSGPPPKPVLRIVFPEGFTRKEMAGRIAAVNEIAEEKRNITPALSPRRYRALAEGRQVPAGFPYRRRVQHLEGFLFPATYEFTEDTTSEQLVAQQLEAFMRAWDQLDLGYARSKNLNAYDVLIIASMVEEEVLVPKERPLVAAVIYNRLRVGLALGIDATIRYGLDIPPTEAIRQSQLESDSPYNTRRFVGLPPTPISNPGLASLQAAAHPAKADYLYFVRKADCKSHFFTASEQEFLDYPRGGLDC